MEISEKPKDLQEYYQHYLTLHQSIHCRRLHFIGQCVTIVYTVFVLYNFYWLMAMAIPFIVYPFAWTGHFIYEKNAPAAFSDPIRAKISDWLMFRDILLGRIKIW